VRRLDIAAALAGTALVIGLLGGCNNKPSSPTGGGTGTGTVTADSPKEIKTANGITMLAIPAGSYKMGSDHDSAEEAPAHTVSISAFEMDKYPVTHEMFAKLQLPDPSHWQENPKTPVERIRWRDAKLFCNERSRGEGLKPCYDEKSANWECDFSANGYRLPTEAEWEYAAKGGTDGSYDFGSKDQLSQYAWFADNSDKKTHPVGDKKPNKYGLSDMYGNVSVWCEDVFDPKYYATSPGADPHGPTNPGKDVKRVVRGGNWKATADMCRNSFRQGERTGDTDACFATDYCGMRCVRRASDNKPSSTAPK